jgi:hypothetical protein
VIRTVAQSGQVTAEVSGQAAGLYGRWEAMVRQDENRVMPGQWNAWVVYRDLMAEVAGSVPQYEAAERVSLAVTDRWRESSFERPVPIYEDPDEEVADSSLMAQVLARLDGIVAGVAGMSEPRLRAEGWDRMKVRAILPAH